MKLLETKDKYLFNIVAHFPKWIKPNHLTLARLILLGPIIYFLLEKKYVWFLIIYLAAWLTDLLDGPLARLRKQTSAWGVFLDPLADRLLFFIPLIIIGPEKIEPFIFWLLIISEMAIYLLALFFSGLLKILKLKFEFGSNIFGKLKAQTQLLIIFLLILALFLNQKIILDLIQVLIYLALGFLCLSLIAAVAKVR